MSAQDPFAQDPIQPQSRLSGRKLLADALKNFVFSFSQGLAAQAQYPGRRGSQAGMAAAIGGPQLLAQIEEQRRQQAQDQQIKLETFRQQVRQNQLQQALSTLNAVQGSQAPEVATAAPQATPMAYPGQVGQGPTMGGGTQQTPLPLRPVPVPGYGNVQPISAQQAAIAKMNELRQAAAIQAENRPDRFASSPQGIFDTGTGQITAPTQKADYSSLVQAVMQNPDLFGTLSDTIQAAIAPTLTAQGFKMPTDYTPEDITVNGKGPVKALKDKRGNYIDVNTRQPIQGTIGVYERPRESAIIGAGGQTIPGDFSKTGEAFLATIPAQWRTTVKKIANYDEDATKVASMRGGNREQLMMWVNQTNPSYDSGLFTNRAPTRKAFTTGIQGRQINAMNTAIAHLDLLPEVSAALKNGTFVPGNELWNRVKTAFGANAVTNFETLKDALAGEVAGVLAQGTATVSGIAAEKSKMGPSNSPEQLAGYTRTLIPIMGGKLNSLDYQYHQAMGADDPFSALSPESKNILRKNGFNPDTNADTVTVRAKDGTVGTIPRANLPEAIKRGATEVK